MSEFATYDVSIALKLKIEVFWLFTISSMVTETRLSSYQLNAQIPLFI